MNKLIGLMPLFILAGCQTSPISPDKADPVPVARLYALQAGGASKVVVTRDSGLYGSGCNVRLYIDGAEAAEFAAGEVATFHVSPGSHVAGVKPSAACGGGGLAEREFSVGQGESIRRRISITPGGIDFTPTAY
ncbi:hypothetical protein [Pseudomonas aeruginosa]|uniref:hypothetical protein n=1 Tax=Pseudomonas aeruginosa TaxID=287 RepID=UPI0027392DBF|nr:hypothetical protein [Pseudomonas aeruginosa]